MATLNSDKQQLPNKLHALSVAENGISPVRYASWSLFGGLYQDQKW